MAGAQRKYPGRVWASAAVPLVDTRIAIEVLDDAVNRLGLMGVNLPGSIGSDARIDAERLEPFYARVEELGLPLFLHPTDAVFVDMLDGYDGALHLSLGRVVEWKNLNLNYKIVARINPETCIGCDLCYIACWDGAHQCIHHEVKEAPAVREARSRQRITLTPIAKLDQAAGGNGHGSAAAPHVPHVDEEECVGCNLCALVCPVEECITMVKVETGKPSESWEQRTAGRVYSKPGQ